MMIQMFHLGKHISGNFVCLVYMHILFMRLHIHVHMLWMGIKPRPIMLTHYAFEQFSKLLPIMLNIMLISIVPVHVQFYYFND